MKQLFCTIFLAITISVVGQRVEKKVQTEIKSLRQQGVDTFLRYSLLFNGGFIELDTCAYEEPQFLLWVKGNDYFIKRFDYCFDYQAMSLDTTNPLSYYLIHKKQINNEKIKSPTYIESKKGNTTTTISSSVDHTSFHIMSFIIGDKQTAKTVSVYDLDFKTFDNGKKNMYYKSNQGTKLKFLIDQITFLIQKLTSEKKFVEE